LQKHLTLGASLISPERAGPFLQCRTHATCGASGGLLNSLPGGSITVPDARCTRPQWRITDDLIMRSYDTAACMSHIGNSLPDVNYLSKSMQVSGADPTAQNQSDTSLQVLQSRRSRAGKPDICQPLEGAYTFCEAKGPSWACRQSIPSTRPLWLPQASLAG
jgi:hypothetical protein